MYECGTTSSISKFLVPHSYISFPNRGVSLMPSFFRRQKIFGMVKKKLHDSEMRRMNVVLVNFLKTPL